MKYQRLLQNSLAIILSIALFAAPVKAAPVDAPQVGSAIKDIVNLLNEYYYDPDGLLQEEMINGALKGLVYALDDYTAYLTPDEYSEYVGGLTDSFVGIGIAYPSNTSGYITISKVYGNSPAEKGGLKAQDTIKKIDGRDINDLSTDLSAAMIAGDEGTSVTLEIQRMMETFEVELTRAKIHTPSVNMYHIEEVLPTAEPNPSVRYIEILSFNDETGEDFAKLYYQCLVENVETLIIDLRDNGGGYLFSAYEIGNRLIPYGTMMQIVDNQGNKEIVEGGMRQVPFDIVVMVNRNTASSSEVLASAIQDSGSGVIVGENTFGKGVIQQLFELVNGGAMKVTVNEYLSRNGNKIHGIGIKPDVVVELPYFLREETNISASSGAGEVRELKQLLAFVGYMEDDGTGLYDDAVSKAVLKVQEDFELAASGVCDTRTQRVLNYLLYDKLMEQDVVLEAAYKEATKK